MFIEFATIIIDIMGLNFFNNKFSIKSTCLKGRVAKFIETDSPTLVSLLILSFVPFLSINLR